MHEFETSLWSFFLSPSGRCRVISDMNVLNRILDMRTVFCREGHDHVLMALISQRFVMKCNVCQKNTISHGVKSAVYKTVSITMSGSCTLWRLQSVSGIISVGQTPERSACMLTSLRMTSLQNRAQVHTLSQGWNNCCLCCGCYVY